MADEMDNAQKYDELYRNSALVKAKAGRIEDEDPLIIEGVRYCLDCAKPIPPARLELQPDARRCVNCQTKKEKRYAKRA
ncbi:MAG: TraR/DksA C4-type zinc finger protein [Smithella sp.]